MNTLELTVVVVECRNRGRGIGSIRRAIGRRLVQPGCSNGLRQISEVQIGSSTWTPSWYGYDDEGHMRTLADASGSITDTYDNDGPIAFSNRTMSMKSVPLGRRESGIGK
jgi:hypothetical protein